MLKKTILFIVLLATIFSACDKEAIIDDYIEETFYIRNGGSDMPAFVRGNTTSKVFILYLQGGPGIGALAVEGYPFGNNLESNYTMVYWDQRHTGNAHGHFDSEEMSLENVVKDVHLLVQAIKMRYGQDNSVFLMGASWGGRLALSYLIENNYQDEINGWISVAGVNTSSSFQDQNERVIELANEEILDGKNVQDWTEILTFFTQNQISENLTFEQNVARREFLNQIRTELISDYLGESALLSKKLTRAGDYLSGEYNFDYFPLQFRDEVEGIFYEDELKIITSPTLLIYGKYDLIVMPSQGERIYDLISSQDKYYKLYEKSGHGPMFTEADLFVTDVTEFIELHK